MKKLLKFVSTVGGMTLLSRVYGFLRDILLARWFGASSNMDAFLVAFKIPNFFRRLFAEGAFANAFVPVLAEYKAKNDPALLKAFIASVAGTFTSILLAVTLIGMGAAPLLSILFAPGFSQDPEKMLLTSNMLTITFPYLALISLTAFTGAILNSAERFAVPAFTPVLLNLSMIGAAIWLSPLFAIPEYGLAWGVLIAGIVQFSFQLPFLNKIGLLVWPSFKFGDKGVTKIMVLMLPTIIGSSVAQINLLLDTVIASFLVAGSVSWLYYADRLVEFPLGVFGIALSTVILPTLSQKYSAEDKHAFSHTLDWALKLVLLIAVPAALGLFLLSSTIVITLFQYQAFSLFDSYMAGLALAAYSLGLPAFILVKVLAPAFYARQDTVTPMKIGIIAMITNMILNLSFVLSMLYFGIQGVHTGLALATSSAAWINAGFLLKALNKRKIYIPGQHWRKLFIQIIIASVIMGISILALLPKISYFSNLSQWYRVGYLLSLIFLGAIVYFIALWSLGLRPQQFITKQ